MKKFLAAVFVWLALSCHAFAWSTTNIGTNSCSACSATLTITAVTIPSGDLGVAAVYEDSATACGSLSDGTHSYTAAVQNNNSGSAGGFTCIFYFYYTSGISSATLTYTLNNTSSFTTFTAFYASGSSATPYDSAALGTGANGSVTSGTPSVSGELFVAIVAATTTNITFTQASGWSAPPNSVTINSTDLIAGGTLVNSGTSTKTFAPTLGGSSPQSNLFILGFEPPASASTTFNRNLMGIGN
jgi:hypothetical protein